MHRSLVTPDPKGERFNYFTTRVSDHFFSEFLHTSMKDSFYIMQFEFVSDFHNSVGFYQFNRAKQLQFSCKLNEFFLNSGSKGLN